MIPVLVERPIYFAVQRIEKSEIGIESGAISFDVVGRNMERILAVVEVANLQITVGLIKLLPAESDVFNFGPTQTLYSNRALAGRERLTNDSEQWAAPKHLGPVNLESNRQHIGAVKRVRSDFLEGELPRRHSLLDHPHIKEKRVRSLICKNTHARAFAAFLVVHLERDDLAGGDNAPALLHRAFIIV